MTALCEGSMSSYATRYELSVRDRSSESRVERNPKIKSRFATVLASGKVTFKSVRRE